jgi:hypothetical protein
MLPNALRRATEGRVAYVPIAEKLRKMLFSCTLLLQNPAVCGQGPAACGGAGLQRWVFRLFATIS